MRFCVFSRKPPANRQVQGSGFFRRGLTIASLMSSLRTVLDAGRHFLADDGWAIASHIALSMLMAMFPFLIVVTALAGFFFGSKTTGRRSRAHSARSLA